MIQRVFNTCDMNSLVGEFSLTYILLLIFTIAAQDMFIALPGQNVTLICDITGVGGTSWRINNMLHTLNELLIGTVAGHSVSGRNIVVEDIMMNDVRNGSQYQCVVIQDPPNPNIEGNMTILYVAGEYKDLICVHCMNVYPECYTVNDKSLAWLKFGEFAYFAKLHLSKNMSCLTSADILDKFTAPIHCYVVLINFSHAKLSSFIVAGLGNFTFQKHAMYLGNKYQFTK